MKKACFSFLVALSLFAFSNTNAQTASKQRGNAETQPATTATGTQSSRSGNASTEGTPQRKPATTTTRSQQAEPSKSRGNTEPARQTPTSNPSTNRGGTGAESRQQQPNVPARGRSEAGNAHTHTCPHAPNGRAYGHYKNHPHRASNENNAGQHIGNGKPNKSKAEHKTEMFRKGETANSIRQHKK